MIQQYKSYSFIWKNTNTKKYEPIVIHHIQEMKVTEISIG